MLSGGSKPQADYKYLFEPGPGSYEIKSTLAAIPQYLLSKKANPIYKWSGGAKAETVSFIIYSAEDLENEKWGQGKKYEKQNY